jgi:hypothetical protein
MVPGGGRGNPGCARYAAGASHAKAASNVPLPSSATPSTPGPTSKPTPSWTTGINTASRSASVSAVA